MVAPRSLVGFGDEEFGRFMLRSGATLYANDFYADPANEYDVCVSVAQ